LPFFSHTPFSLGKKIALAFTVIVMVAAGTLIVIYLAQMRAGYVANLRSKQLLQEAQSSTDPNRVLVDAEGFSIIARLDIEAINLTLPVIGTCTEPALNVSVCRFLGPQTPGDTGNLVIMGHNYRDGSHFGKLDKLKVGDKVQLMDVFGHVYYYEVYEMVRVVPRNTDALNVYSGERGLTMATYGDNGDRRLVVRCREILSDIP
jgi:LPXTG-site transpeptidase (sortase) family protein